MEPKLGYDEVKKLVLGVIDAGNACGAVFEDGKIGFGDIGALMAFAHSAKEIALVDYKRAFPEIKDLDPGEMDDLVALVETELELPHDEVEDKVVAVLGLAQRWHALINETILFVRNPEAVG